MPKRTAELEAALQQFDERRKTGESVAQISRDLKIKSWVYSHWKKTQHGQAKASKGKQRQAYDPSDQDEKDSSPSPLIPDFKCQFRWSSDQWRGPRARALSQRAV